ncbi:hypothetical protein SEA_JACOREN57_10 [Mycobacterium phage JacoRen57]|nr:hypothetical protein SEA_JACOREN57_10 [Mycobacterium phage JacoRen57]
MSKRAKINGARLVALRTSPRQLQILTALGTAIQDAANRDFAVTASSREKRIQEEYSRSDTPYDITARTGTDRVRVYVQTASLPARRHEHSTRGSSLLRALKG